MDQRPGWPSWFSKRQKQNTHTNLVEDVETLLPVKFRWILISGFKGEVKYVSANQRPGGHLVFLIGLKILGRGSWDIASCQVSLNSVQKFQRRSRKCFIQLEARAAILFCFFFFSISPKKHKLRRRWDLASCQVSLNPVKRFQRRSKQE